MDTSETYIKMRLGAIPDLGTGKEPLLHPYQAWVTNHPDGYVRDVFLDYRGNWYFLGKDVTLKLERQDQLQEMVLEKKQTTLLEPLAKLCLEFDEFIHPDNYCLHGNREPGMFSHEYCQECVVKGNLLFQQFTSMEQLWLAFVMKEKYNKVWVDGEWVNVTNL